MRMDQDQSISSVTLSDGTKTEIQIVKSNRAKRLSLRASRHGIYAIVPNSTSHDEIMAFIDSKKEWITKSSTYFEKITRGLDPMLIQQGKVFFLGATYDIHLVKDRYCYVIISVKLRRITIHSPNKNKRKKTIIEFYRQHTSRILDERIKVLSSQLNLNFNRILIKYHRSRWGSCSLKKNLNFNVMLSALPSGVIDYVIVHELSHLLELNHSERFWELVRSSRPTYKEDRKWLRMYGPFINLPLSSLD
jgi:predicted metal-dependent hydrolase